MASIEGFNFPASCISTSDCTFIFLEKERFIESLHNTKNLSFKIIKAFFRKVKTLESNLDRALMFDRIIKVASYIVENSEQFKTKNNEFIANELNLTAEIFSQVLKKMRELKLIDDNNIILDKDKLELLINF